MAQKTLIQVIKYYYRIFVDAQNIMWQKQQFWQKRHDFPLIIHGECSDHLAWPGPGAKGRQAQAKVCLIKIFIKTQFSYEKQILLWNILIQNTILLIKKLTPCKNNNTPSFKYFSVGVRAPLSWNLPKAACGIYHGRQKHLKFIPLEEEKYRGEFLYNGFNDTVLESVF